MELNVRRWTAALVAAGTVMLCLGGCVASTRERAPASGKVGEVLNSGAGHFDLTRPPSREEAGMPDGEPVVTYERGDRSPINVRVSLPEGNELALDARLVGIDSYGSPDPSAGPPTTLDIHYYADSLAAARDHLLAAAREFGLDEQAVTDWYEQARGSRPEGAPPTVRSRWLSTPVGYLVLQVRGSYRPPVDAADAGSVLVHYSLAWG